MGVTELGNILDDLIDRIEDSSLREGLLAEIAKLRDAKDFGLVFERHLPETARLPQHPIRRGSQVAKRLANDELLGRVQHVTGGIAAVRWDDGTVEEHPANELAVVAEFGEAVYPGLRPVGMISTGGDKPYHLVINGENYHGLQLLQYTHAAKVDVIYIDPPYNLGSDLTYNDKRVAKEDRFRHSKWLSFMDRRLRLAKDLLKSTGVVIVAIDDTEQAHLRLLMDQIFGEQNFISTIVWQGGRKNDSRYVSVGHDYMLIYAKNEATLREQEIIWREPKPGVEEVLAAGTEAWEASGHDPEAATQILADWWKGQSKKQYAAGLRMYRFIDDQGDVYRGFPIDWPGGGGPTYDVLHPRTGKPCKVPKRGWVYASAERMQEMIDAGLVLFGEDHTTVPQRKALLREQSVEVARSVFESERARGAKRLTALLGENRFTFPKDTEVLSRWIELVTNRRDDAVVLDFFVGSGSTVQAVMELNARDGGRRQCIAITNNEVDEKLAKKLTRQGLVPGDPEWEQWGIFEYVTKPRIETLVTGQRPDGSEYSDGLDENVEFFDLQYLNPDRVARGRAFKEIAPLLWAAVGASGARIDEETDQGWAAPEGARYAVLFDTAAVRGLTDALEGRDDINRVFVITDSEAQYQQVIQELPSHVETTMLWSDYLENFAIGIATQP